MNETLNNLIVKYIDYGTEEYAKTLLTKVNSSRSLENINPFVGVLLYPSDMFLQTNLEYHKTVQFQNSTYLGYMDFLLPPLDAFVDVGLAYTLLSFNLDGVKRQFVQISSGLTSHGGLSFKDFILKKYPKGDPSGFVFNRSALHYITDIEISGGNAVIDPDGTFTIISTGTGSFTPSIEFEIGVSGYVAIIL
ncbi:MULTISPECIES: hypothetical protein [unclassified Mucilaginibacter]|uniref:hypothetical protein n=1 Tax=unclassified Mucilaginibacter TaxID=2617802 RepID=UPI002AC967D3|nr:MULTISPECIES: hypothetical protein [unclassified Mucilaginibacter]MEB0260751.1 hypothetical protein [Mucilaginibacter sp. 10I4]MEB0302365.1 hypothetical protein [Mucilaginibacter sp. 5C4]WPX22143.1 hypothetical protein RHM67_12710 [Mucilaginibacter sp. 5C4]